MIASYINGNTYPMQQESYDMKAFNSVTLEPDIFILIVWGHLFLRLLKINYAIL